MGAFAKLFAIGILLLAGWVAGSFYPAPASMIASINPQILAARTRGDLTSVHGDWATVESYFSQEDGKRLMDDAVRFAQQTGSAIKVEHVVDEATKDAEMQQYAAQTPTASVAKTANVPTPSSAGSSVRDVFEALVSLCPGMTISDAPPADAGRHIANFSSRVSVNGDIIAVDPIRDACLSSGFGVRDGKLHKGIDFYNALGGPILAAGDGTVLEMKYRDDYGNMVLIDHGHGVYTRYAHLSSFQTGLKIGARIHAGDQIGLMGNTASYPVPLHLHYELLLGDYNNPKGSFGLVPHSPFEFHAVT